MNGILLVDKPEGWTSHDVVAKLRGVMHEKRAGHSGTLDPMATGLLAVFFGRATRAVEFAEADEKEYTAGIRFGLTTDTQDITGAVLREQAPDFTAGQLSAALEKFRGGILQVPPMYSAIKVGGKKLYEIARRGGSVERAPRPVHIFVLEAEGLPAPEMTLRVRCSKGTYVRTLCHDIGAELGCGACLSSLRRTRAGLFDISRAHTLEEIIAAADAGAGESLLLPVDTLFADRPRAVLPAGDEKRLRSGCMFSTALPDGEYRACSETGEFLALTRAEDGAMRLIKSFYEV